MTTRAIRLGGALLIAAALIVTGCGGGPAAPSPAPADEEPMPMQELAPVPHPGAASKEVAAPGAWSGHASEPDVAHMLSPPSTGTGGGSSTPRPPLPPLPPVVYDGTYLTAPAGCCGCAGGDEGWGWNTRTDGACGFSGTIVPGLCGCELYRDTTDSNSAFVWRGLGC